MIKGKAPCSHVGTYVTNTFISCDLRCEFAGYVTPNAPVRLGYPSHDLDCTCQKCEVCKFATLIHFYDSSGKLVAEHSWDGVSTITGSKQAPWYVGGYALFGLDGNHIIGREMDMDVPAGSYEVKPMRLPGI
mgnify:FL=1